MSENSSIYSRLWGDLFAGHPTVSFKKNAVIIEEGETIDRVYYIVSGRVKFSIITSEGNEKTMYVLNKGSVFGDVWSAAHRPYFLSATTLTKCTLAYKTPTEFIATVSSNPQYMQDWLSYICEIVEFLVEHITDITFLDREALLRKYLYRLSFNYGIPTNEGMKLNTRITHQLLADLIGCSRVTISKIMAKLLRTGELTKIDGYFYILDINSFKDADEE